MTAPLTPAETAAAFARVDAMSARAVELNRKAAENRQEADDLSSSIADGKPGARENAARLEAEAKVFELEAAACRTEEAKAQAKLDADAPHQAARRAAERKAQFKQAIGVGYAKAERCDQSSRALIADLKDFTASLDDIVAAGGDPHIRHQLLMQYVLEPMLMAAGITDLMPHWSTKPRSSLEEAIRGLVRA